MSKKTKRQTQEKINPNVHKHKETIETTSGPTKEEIKITVEDTEKRTVMQLVAAPFVFAWDHGIKPAGLFVWGIATKGWGSVLDWFSGEVADFQALGALKYFLDRGAKVMIKATKLAAAVTIAFFVNQALMAVLGVSLFNPMTLLVLASVAIVFIIIRSILAQREAGADVSMKATGEHVLEAILAA